MGENRKKEMLRQIAEYYGISKNSDFAKFFGLSIQTSFQRLKSGYLDYEEIYAKCPDISPDWLLSGGEGPMLRSERDDYVAGPKAEGEAKGESVRNEKSMDAVLEALGREQEALARSQAQISGLIELLKGKAN